jgi:hypothetical protein
MPVDQMPRDFRRLIAEAVMPADDDDMMVRSVGRSADRESPGAPIKGFLPPADPPCAAHCISGKLCPCAHPECWSTRPLPARPSLTGGADCGDDYEGDDDDGYDDDGARPLPARR